jgi:sortase A
MRKLFVLVLFIALVFGGVTVGIKAVKQLNNKNPAEVRQQLSPKKERVPAKQPEETIGTPKTIKISKININAPIESVGLDKERKMDVPKDPGNGGWYNLGAKPGEKGNAVIAGHYDKADGSPAVFWNLNKLVEGDKIIIEDGNGKERTFSVVKTAKYPYNNFPLEEVFGASSKSMLNLITCQGKWNTGTRNYSERLVVYAKLEK